MLKKILKRTFLVLGILIVMLILAPFLLKKQILQAVKKEINQNIHGTIDFADVNISFFRDFPKVSLALEEVKLVGKGEFSNDTLLQAQNINAAVNFMSVIKGSDFRIYSVEINEPKINAIVHKNGKANWDLSIPDSSVTGTAATASAFKMKLEKYAIHKGSIKYRDEEGGMSSEILNLEHEGSGDFTADLFTLKTKTSADELSFDYAGIPYFSRTRTSIDADLEIDNKTGRYSFKTDKISLNDLKLSSEGYFQMGDTSYNMDIRFNAPSTEFKNILSLIPSIYQKDFSSLKTSGTAVFNGFVKGIYSNYQMPAYSVHLDVKNGFFQYIDLPKPVKNINLTMDVENPDGVTDHTVINIPKAHIEMDADPFDFHLQVKNPVSDMWIDAGVKGKLDLSKMAQLVKFEKGTKLAGLLDADLAVKGAVSAMQKQDFDRFTASGNMNLSQFYYASADYPDGVKLDVLKSTFNPKNITVSQLDGQYMKTNFSASGTIDNLLAYALKDQPLSGKLQVNADVMNLDQWMGTSSDTTTQGTVAAAPFLVPGNLDFQVTSKVDRIIYDKLELKNLTGALSVKDETVFMKDIRADALDGSMIINGSYSTKLDKKKPDISLNYDVKGLDVQKTFYAFNTVQKLMPVGKFIAGKLSSKLSLTGKLGDNMMPDLNSLTGNGNLLLIEGFLQKFAPVDKLASMLNVQTLQGLSLKDVKNYIEFTNGKVMIKPFHVKVKDIDMEIGGAHGFDQSLDYIINMKLPRALMGTQGNKLIDNLVSQANSKGIAVKAGEIVNLKVNMTGFINDPLLKTNLKEAASSMTADLKQQATDFAKAKADSAKKMVKDSVIALKNQVVASAKVELLKKLSGTNDSTTAHAPLNANDLKKKAEGTGKDLMKNLFGKKAKKDTAQH